MKKCLLVLTLLLAASAISCFPEVPTIGCPNPGKNRAAKCSAKHDFAGNAWYGPDHCTDNEQENRKLAQNDADNHNRSNPGHGASVVP